LYIDQLEQVAAIEFLSGTTSWSTYLSQCSSGYTWRSSSFLVNPPAPTPVNCYCADYL